MNDDRYETMSDDELQTAVVNLQRERNTGMTEIEETRSRVSKVNDKISQIMAEIGRRNYETMIQNFELTAEHVTLLRKYGSQVAEITDSELQIAETLGWKVADEGLTERQEANIARLLGELQYAQSFINKQADGLVNAKGPQS